MQNRLLTLKEVAAYLNVTTRTLSKYIKEGLLKAKLLPSGEYRIYESDVEKLLL